MGVQERKHEPMKPWLLLVLVAIRPSRNIRDVSTLPKGTFALEVKHQNETIEKPLEDLQDQLEDNNNNNNYNYNYNYNYNNNYNNNNNNNNNYNYNYNYYYYNYNYYNHNNNNYNDHNYYHNKNNYYGCNNSRSLWTRWTRYWISWWRRNFLQ